MQLSDGDIEEFRAIWKKQFKEEEISVAYARERAAQLLELFALLAKKPPSKDQKKGPATE